VSDKAPSAGLKPPEGRLVLGAHSRSPQSTFRYTRGVKPGKDASSDRREWPVRKYTLGQEPGDDLSATTTPEDRIAMMWPLALEAWALTGAAVPEYERAKTPVRKLRRDSA